MGAPLSPQLRSRICELHARGYSVPQIHRIHNVNISTIRTTIRRESLRIDNTTRPRSGRPPTINAELRDHLYDIVTNIDPFITVRKLTEEADGACENTVRALMREMGRRKWIALCRPLLSAANAADRLAWATIYRHYRAPDWIRVVWSDECSVERGVGKGKKWIWLSAEEIRSGARLLPQNVQTRPCGKGIRQMFWAAFSYGRRTNLVSMISEEGSRGVTAIVYREILDEYLSQIYSPGDIFMHDNAPIHTAHIIRDWIIENGINVMIWPPYSPDLNPIENLWALLKKELYRLYPELESMANNEQTRQLMIRGAEHAWDNIKDEVLANLHK